MSLQFVVVAILVFFAVESTGEIGECKDLMEDPNACLKMKKEEPHSCEDPPWNSQCRLTCGLCGKCGDAENFATCEKIKNDGGCDTPEGAHKCSETCGAWTCKNRVRRVFHMS